MPVQTVIQPRRGTAALWTSTNPVLAIGETGLETDTLKTKLGDGATAWNSLAYQGANYSTVGHTHTASQISDSTATGRSVLTAVDAPAARTAIGAGTSNLALGTTGTTAMAGNTTFAFSQITGSISTAQLPPIAINDTFPVVSQAAMLALTAQRGDVAIRSDIGKTFILSTDNPGTLADWLEVVTTGAVSSVAGRTGAVVLTKTDVGLANVDNTADTAKPVSTAQQTALNAKENSITAGTTAQVWRGDKTWIAADKTLVGLANVDNTADTAKPVSTAQQTALNAKENSVTAGTTAQVYRGDKTWVTADKTLVGLGNVDNTSDVNKPVSTATTTALAGKEPTLAAGTAGQYYRGDKTWATHDKASVGLGNVDNTSDVNKPVSTATTTALAGKANTSHTHTSADILSIDGGTP